MSSDDDHERETLLDGSYGGCQSCHGLADLLVDDEQLALIVDAGHTLAIRDEVRGDVTALELHTFDDDEVVVDGALLQGK